jgi:hypothetical protein
MAMRPIRGYRADNRYPDSEHKLRHLYRNRTENGLAPAFAKVQGRVLFDPERMDALLAAHNRSEAAA